MNKEVFSVLFTLLHTLLERVPSLEVLIIHIADFLSMIMFNYERMSAWFHPVDMEEGFVIRVDLGRNVCDRVGIGHEGLLVLHNCHYYTRPIILVELLQS